MIPLFDRIIYPLLRKCGLPMHALTRMICGMLLCSVSFVISGLLQISIDRCAQAQCVSIFWQVPQYVVITAGEIMFSITGLEFAYSQAPKSMKSICQSAWLLTVAFGNLIVVIIAGSKIFPQVYIEYFFFAGLMLVATIIFWLMSRSFQYKVPEEDKHEE
jgi:dipeptide/tripeptide permease